MLLQSDCIGDLYVLLDGAGCGGDSSGCDVGDDYVEIWASAASHTLDGSVHSSSHVVPDALHVDTCCTRRGLQRDSQAIWRVKGYRY